MSRARAWAGSLAKALRQLAKGREASAAVEFALVLPIMLTMYLGSMELGQAFSVDQRITIIAGTVGDLVARADGSISGTTLDSYFQAAQAIVGPFSTTGLKQVVTVVHVDNAGVTNVEWSKGYNGGSPKATGVAYPGPNAIPTAMLAISHNSIVVVSEATYAYTPLLGLFFKQPFNLDHQNFYLPRFPGDIACTGC